MRTQTLRLSDEGLNGRLAKSEKLHSSARLFHSLVALSGSRETLPVTQHQPCHQQHDTVLFFQLQHTPVLYLNVHQPHLSVQLNTTAGRALGSPGPFFLSRFLIQLSSLMAEAEELEGFTHNLIRGDLCVAGSHGALGPFLRRHKLCFCDRLASIHYAVVRAEVLRYSRGALAPGSSAILGTVDQDLRKCVLTRHHFYLM